VPSGTPSRSREESGATGRRLRRRSRRALVTPTAPSPRAPSPASLRRRRAPASQPGLAPWRRRGFQLHRQRVRLLPSLHPYATARRVTRSLKTAEASSRDRPPPRFRQGRSHRPTRRVLTRRPPIRRREPPRRAPCRRSSAMKSAGPSRRRSRVQLPSAAHQPRNSNSTRRPVDVVEWRRRRSTKPESAGSTPAVDAHLAVARWMRAPPSEGGRRTFESCRRDQPFVQGNAAVVQRVRHRVLNPGSGVQLPVAAPMPDRLTGRTSDCYSDGGGSSPPLAATARWPSIQARGCNPRHAGERPARAFQRRSDATERGSFHSNTPREGKLPLQAGGARSGIASLHPVHGSTHVIVVQRRGPQHATLKMRVRLPPITPPARCEGRGLLHLNSEQSNCLRSPGPRAGPGPEALMVERPVETRKEEIRTLLGPPTRLSPPTLT